MKKNVVFVIIVLVSLLLAGYGLKLEAEGYTAEGAEGRYVALALRKLRRDPMLLRPVELPAAEDISDGSEAEEADDFEQQTDESITAASDQMQDTPDEGGASDHDILRVITTYDPSDTEDEEASWPPEFVAADDSYFDDAVFIGDSRMVGVAYYSGITNGHFLAKTSMNIFWMLDADPETDDSVSSVREGLMRQQYKKIYLLTGINEAGTDTDYFVQHYKQVIREIRRMQPGALIYIHAVTHVSATLSASNPSFANARIDEKNAALRKMAEDLRVVFLDINEAFDDENGCLPEASTWDGVHPSGELYPIWKEYLLTHTVEVND